MDRQATATTDMMVATDRVTAEQAILGSLLPTTGRNSAELSDFKIVFNTTVHSMLPKKELNTGTEERLV
jgi:hypothetical protein